MIALLCPYCRHQWSVAADLGGSSVWCPQCGTPNDVPRLADPSVVDLPTIDSTQRASLPGLDFSTFLSPPQGPEELGWMGGYRILRPIGEGGMGIVFEAEDPRLKRSIALKVMRPEAARSDIARRRFLREGEAAGQLEHDHILPIYHIGEDRGTLFLTMPLLQGETLEACLRRQPVLPIPAVLALGRQVAEGLAAAHAKGLIHRDVKPGNIWLEALDQRAIILDFGLARSVALGKDVTLSGTIVGSPAFMAPEQASGTNVGPPADLFSLGCVLYLCSTGQRPFPGSEIMAVLLALANKTPLAPIRIRHEIPGPLSDLIMSLLEKNPAERPASAADVARSLSRMEAAGRSPGLAPVEWTRPAGSFKTRLRDLWKWWAGLLLVLGVLALWLRQRPDPSNLSKTGSLEAKAELSQPAAQNDWHREVAERILEAKGQIQVRFLQEAGTRDVGDRLHLPADPFRIQMITLDKIQNVEALMDWLHDLDDLNCLKVSESPLTDAGVLKLRNLPDFEWLILKDTRFSGSGLAALRHLPRLRLLDIVDCPVSDDGLSQLGELPALERLRLQSTQVRGPGLKHLDRLPNLRALYLTNSPVNDTGLRTLPALPHLSELILNGTAVTDEGTEGLASLKSLNQLYLENTRVTRPGADRYLQRLGKECKVVLGREAKAGGY